MIELLEILFDQVSKILTFEKRFTQMTPKTIDKYCQYSTKTINPLH